MKKLITTIFFVYSITGIAQITIGTVEKQPEPIAPVITPKDLDSLSDFKTETIFENYTMYVGQLFYLPPKPDRDAKIDANSYIYKKHNVQLLSTYPKEGSDPYNNYYKLIRVVTDKQIEALLQNNLIWLYHTERYIDLKKNSYFLNGTYFMFKSEKDGDTLYWSPNDRGDFIFVPYFIKQKALYENKNFYFNEKQTIQVQDLSNLKNTIDIEPKSKWTCKEVSILTESQLYNGVIEEDKYVICYILKNDKNQSFARKINPFYPEIRENNVGYTGKFLISEQEFIKTEKIQDKNEEMERLKKESDNLKKIQEDKIHEQELVKKYGQANVDLVKSGQVKIGMTKELCIEAWGVFFKPTKVVNDNGTFETWEYNAKQILYFKDGILIQIVQEGY